MMKDIYSYNTLMINFSLYFLSIFSLFTILSRLIVLCKLSSLDFLSIPSQYASSKLLSFARSSSGTQTQPRPNISSPNLS